MTEPKFLAEFQRFKHLGNEIRNNEANKIELHHMRTKSDYEIPLAGRGAGTHMDSGCSADESAASPEAQTKQHQCGDNDSR